MKHGKISRLAQFSNLVPACVPAAAGRGSLQPCFRAVSFRCLADTPERGYRGWSLCGIGPSGTQTNLDSRLPQQ